MSHSSRRYFGPLSLRARARRLVACVAARLAREHVWPLAMVDSLNPAAAEAVQFLDDAIPREIRARFCHELEAVRAAIGNDARAVDEIVHAVRPYVGTNVFALEGRELDWVLEGTLNNCAIKSLSAMGPLRLETAALVFDYNRSISSTIQIAYPEHKPRHMVRLFKALCSDAATFSTFGDVLSLVENHPGFTARDFAKGALRLAREDVTPVAAVLDQLAQEPAICELVLSLAAAEAPGGVDDLCRAARAIVRPVSLRA
jgi:hypothetical protein